MEVSTKREGLRILLDKDAADACSNMLVRLKAESPHISVRPSAFVGFVLKKYFTDYLDNDLATLVAAFFDAEAFYEAEVKRVKSQGGSFEQAINEAFKTLGAIRRPEETSGLNDKKKAMRRKKEHGQYAKKMEKNLD